MAGRAVTTRRARLAALGLAAALGVACGGSDAQRASPPISPDRKLAPAQTTPSVSTAARPLLPSGAWQLAVANGVVSVDAVEAPRRPLLEALAQRAGFALEAAPGAWPPLTLRLDAQPLESALPLLVGELEYRAEWTRADGAHRLARLVVSGPRAAAASASDSGLRQGEVSDALHRALREIGSNSETLSEAEALQKLKDEDPEARLRAVLALEGDGDGLTALVSTIQHDPDPRVRAGATVGLEDSEEFAALQALVGALGDANPEVVLEAIDSLEFAGDASVVASLQPLLAHSDARVRKAAADAIKLLGE